MVVRVVARDPYPLFDDRPDVVLIERSAQLEERFWHASKPTRERYRDMLEKAWIRNDAGLEGSVFELPELQIALDNGGAGIASADTSIQPVCEEIVKHKRALDFARAMMLDKSVPADFDLFRRIYLHFHPEDGDIAAIKYRKDIPQHRLYLHEYCAPDKIPARLQGVFAWMQSEEAAKIKNPIKLAARVHYDLVRIFPFSQNSGTVARLFMNIMLVRAGLAPAILHVRDRNTYYESLKGSLPHLVNLVTTSVHDYLVNVSNMLDKSA
jgi:Fic family protein